MSSCASLSLSHPTTNNTANTAHPIRSQIKIFLQRKIKENEATFSLHQKSKHAETTEEDINREGAEERLFLEEAGGESGHRVETEEPDEDNNADEKRCFPTIC
eukprot:GHVS01060066.1.p2 GENE.GHVS01060066.1~~GHVS01060066.1.p2  ORF type:complete len:103 (-),score=30.97 GHVS01060066.1:33-341(-)